MMDGNDARRLQDSTTSAASGRSGISPAFIAIVLLVAVTAVFILQNRERTTIDFLVFEVRSRVWTAIAVAIGLGVLLDRLVSIWWRRRKRARASQG